jgi:hypothetical protein
LPSAFYRALGKEFVECHLVLGKEKSPSWRQVTVTDPLPSGKARKTLGKVFAECNTRQRTLGELYIGNSLFAEYCLSGTRQRKVAVTAPSDGDGSFAECLPWHSAKRPILPSVFCHGPRQRRLQWAPPPVPVPRALVGVST